VYRCQGDGGALMAKVRGGGGGLEEGWRARVRGTVASVSATYLPAGQGEHPVLVPKVPAGQAYCRAKPTTQRHSMRGTSATCKTHATHKQGGAGRGASCHTSLALNGTHLPCKWCCQARSMSLGCRPRCSCWSSGRGRCRIGCQGRCGTARHSTAGHNMPSSSFTQPTHTRNIKHTQGQVSPTKAPVPIPGGTEGAGGGTRQRV
jgi:hypothetical protein